MAAVGVRCSLSLPTATKAMTWTLSLWLVGQVLIAFIAISIIAIVTTFFVVAWSVALQYYLIPLNSPPWFPISWSTAWALTTDLVTLVIAILIVVETGMRFDRIAGRMAGGTVATAVDAFLHGPSHKAILLPGRQRRARKSVLPDPAEPLATAPALTSRSGE